MSFYKRSNLLSVSAVSCVLTLSIFANSVQAEQVFTDSFNKVVSVGWGDAEVNGSWDISSNYISDFSVDGSRGVVDIVGGNGSRIAVLAADAINVEATATISWSELPLVDYIYGGLALRVSDDKKNYYLARIRNSSGRVVLVIDKVINGSSTSLGNIGLPIPFLANNTYNLRFQVVGTNPSVVRVRAWPTQQVEPGEWSLKIDDNEVVLQSDGGVGIKSGSGSSYAGAAKIYVDNYSTSICNDSIRSCFSSYSEEGKVNLYITSNMSCSTAISKLNSKTGNTEGYSYVGSSQAMVANDGSWFYRAIVGDCSPLSNKPSRSFSRTRTNKYGEIEKNYWSLDTLP